VNVRAVGRAVSGRDRRGRCASTVTTGSAPPACWPLGGGVGEGAGVGGEGVVSTGADAGGEDELSAGAGVGTASSAALGAAAITLHATSAAHNGHDAHEGN
jgi:hypothetical protein